MALSRKFLAALGIESDKVDEIINAHTEVTDALKNERDSYKADAEKLPAVQRELDELKAAKEKDGKDPYKVKYEALKEDFEQYKQDQIAKEEKAKKTEVYRDLLKQAGVAEKRIDAVLKVTDLNAIKLGEDGKAEGTDALLESIKTEWADFITQPSNQPARVSLGGSLAGGGTKTTVDEIMAIQDDAKRQQAILENHALFGF